MISVKLYAIIAAAFVIVGGAFGLGWHLGALGPKAALATERLAQERNRAAIQATADKAIADATRDKETAIAANEVISNDYQAQLLAARASASELLKRVHQYENSLATRGHQMPAPANNGGTAPASGVPSGQEKLDGLLAAYDTACQRDAAKLNALIAEITPQLP